MVNRVFCYSKDTAKKYGNKLPILELVLTTIIGIVIFIAISIIMTDFNVWLFLFFMFVWLGLIIYYSVILGLVMRSRMSAYAVTSDGRIFKAMTVNNGQGLYFGGVAAGGLLDQIMGNDSGVGESLGGAVGAAAQFYAMNRSAEYMSHPEIVAKMVESAPNITGAEVYEILNVYSITDKGKSFKVNCDYKIVRTNKIKSRKNLRVDKSYITIDDLVNMLNTHKVY